MKRLILTTLAIIIMAVCFAQTQFCSTYKDEIIIEKKHLVISYSKDLKVPNYVAYSLTKEMTIGEAKRDNEKFYEDFTCPMGFRAKPSDYTNSGYDRGHMSPAADWNYDSESMHDSFSMANIAPQKPQLNRRYWKEIEDIERYIANLVDTAYVITGTIFNKNISYIKNHVAVPAYFFKTIVGVSNHQVVVVESYVYKNVNTKQTIEKNICTIDHVESLIGKDLYQGFWFNEKYESKVMPKTSFIVNNTDYFCKATTKKGTRCTRKAVKNGYCSQHNK